MKKIYIILFAFVIVLLGLILVTFKKETSTPNLNLSISSSWIKEFVGNNKILSQPIYYNGNLFIQTSSAIYSLDAISGNLLWETKIPPFQSSDIFYDSLPMRINDTFLIVLLEANTIAAFNSKNGDLLWVSNEIPFVPNAYSDKSISIYDLEIQNDLVFVSRWNNTLAAYNIVSGSLVWNKVIPPRTTLDIIPYREKVLLNTLDTLYFYNNKDGTEVGNLSHYGDTQGNLLEDDTLYIAFDNGKCSVAALNLETRTYKWCISPFENYYFSHPVLFISDGDYVYIYTHEKIIAISKEGIINWAIKPSTQIERVYINNSSLYAVNAYMINSIRIENGVEKEILIIEEQNSKWLPIIEENLMFIFEINKIYAYKN
ncbi:MAG: PQQ-binding-like beta-propeller repeat protein [Anaerolineales bacterium]|nr:PQQ-binding-like beta-propeller repeat protein [Anaerolineales bacterium]